MTQTIAEIDKNSIEKIRATLSVYKGKDRVDLRVYYQVDNNEWRPTKKGINLSVDSWDDFKGLVRKVDKAISERVK